MTQDSPLTPSDGSVAVPDTPLPGATALRRFFGTRRGQIAGYLLFVASALMFVLLQYPEGLTEEHVLVVGIIFILGTLSTFLFFYKLAALAADERLSAMAPRLLILGYWIALGGCALFLLFAYVDERLLLINQLVSVLLATVALFAFGLYRVTQELRLAAPRLAFAALLFALIPTLLIVTQMTFGTLGVFLVAGAYLGLLALARRVASRVRASQAFATAEPAGPVTDEERCDEPREDTP